MAFRMNIKTFLTREENLSWFACKPSYKRCMMLYAHVLFTTKAATYEHAMNLYRFLRDAKHTRHFMAIIVNVLATRMQMNYIAFTICYSTFRFHECMICLRCGIVICYYKCSLCNSLIYIAAR